MKYGSPKKLKAIDIKTMPYPGFPTDMQSIMAATFTIAKGTTIVVENIFENRYKYVQELNKMGAKRGLILSYTAEKTELLLEVDESLYDERELK